MKLVKKLFEKIEKFFENNASKHPENIYIGDKRYTREELNLDDKDMENVSDEVKLLNQQRDALGVKPSDNPQDDNDKIIERATNKHLRTRNTQTKDSDEQQR